MDNMPWKKSENFSPLANPPLSGLRVDKLNLLTCQRCRKFGWLLHLCFSLSRFFFIFFTLFILLSRLIMFRDDIHQPTKPTLARRPGTWCRRTIPSWPTASWTCATIWISRCRTTSSTRRTTPTWPGTSWRGKVPSRSTARVCSPGAG